MFCKSVGSSMTLLKGIYNRGAECCYNSKTKNLVLGRVPNDFWQVNIVFAIKMFSVVLSYRDDTLQTLQMVKLIHIETI